MDFTSTDGTATTGDSDYTTNLGTLTFGGANPATQQITVNVTGDTKVEADELFTVDLSFPVAPPAGVSFSDNQGDGNITNDDSATIAINDVTLAEGNAGPTAFTFDVTLTGRPPPPPSMWTSPPPMEPPPPATVTTPPTSAP